MSVANGFSVPHTLCVHLLCSTMLGLIDWSLQIWRNVESLQKGGELMELAANLSQLFEDLFKKQVHIFVSHMDTCDVRPIHISYGKR